MGGIFFGSLPGILMIYLLVQGRAREELEESSLISAGDRCVVLCLTDAIWQSL